MANKALENTQFSSAFLRGLSGDFDKFRHDRANASGRICSKLIANPWHLCSRDFHSAMQAGFFDHRICIPWSIALSGKPLTGKGAPQLPFYACSCGGERRFCWTFPFSLDGCKLERRPCDEDDASNTRDARVKKQSMRSSVATGQTGRLP